MCVTDIQKAARKGSSKYGVCLYCWESSVMLSHPPTRKVWMVAYKGTREGPFSLTHRVKPHDLHHVLHEVGVHSLIHSYTLSVALTHPYTTHTHTQFLYTLTHILTQPIHCYVHIHSTFVSNFYFSKRKITLNWSCVT